MQRRKLREEDGNRRCSFSLVFSNSLFSHVKWVPLVDLFPRIFFFTFYGCSFPVTLTFRLLLRIRMYLFCFVVSFVSITME